MRDEVVARDSLEVQEENETEEYYEVPRQSLGDRFRAWGGKLKEQAADWFTGRYSKEDLEKQEKRFNRATRIQDVEKEIQIFEGQRKDAEEGDLKRIDADIAEAKARVNEFKAADKVEWGEVGKGVGKGSVDLMLFLTGTKFFPDVARWAVQQSAVSSERERILTEESEGETASYDAHAVAVKARIEASRHVSVADRRELLARVDAVEAKRRENIAAAAQSYRNQGAQAVLDYQIEKGIIQQGERAGMEQVLHQMDAEDIRSELELLRAEANLTEDEQQRLDSLIAAYGRDHGAIQSETEERIKQALVDHIRTRVSATEVAKQLVNTIATAAGFGALRAGGYTAAAVYERYEKLGRKKKKEVEVGGEIAEVSAKELFLDGMTETMKDLAFQGGATKTDKALRFAKAAGATLRAGSLVGMTVGEMTESEFAFSKLWEKAADKWAAVGGEDAARLLWQNSIQRVEDMGGFLKKLFGVRQYGADLATAMEKKTEIVEEKIETPHASRFFEDTIKNVGKLKGNHDSISQSYHDMAEAHAKELGLEANDKAYWKFALDMVKKLEAQQGGNIKDLVHEGDMVGVSQDAHGEFQPTFTESSGEKAGYLPERPAAPVEEPKAPEEALKMAPEEAPIEKPAVEKVPFKVEETMEVKGRGGKTIEFERAAVLPTGEKLFVNPADVGGSDQRVYTEDGHLYGVMTGEDDRGNPMVNTEVDRNVSAYKDVKVAEAKPSAAEKTEAVAASQEIKVRATQLGEPQSMAIGGKQYAAVQYQVTEAAPGMTGVKLRLTTALYGKGGTAAGFIGPDGKAHFHEPEEGWKYWKIPTKIEVPKDMKAGGAAELAEHEAAGEHEEAEIPFDAKNVMKDLGGIRKQIEGMPKDQALTRATLWNYSYALEQRSKFFGSDAVLLKKFVTTLFPNDALREKALDMVPDIVAGHKEAIGIFINKTSDLGKVNIMEFKDAISGTMKGSLDTAFTKKTLETMPNRGDVIQDWNERTLKLYFKKFLESQEMESVQAVFRGRS